MSCSLFDSLDQIWAFAAGVRRSNSGESVTIGQSTRLGYIRRKERHKNSPSSMTELLLPLMARLPRLLRIGPRRQDS